MYSTDKDNQQIWLKAILVLLIEMDSFDVAIKENNNSSQIKQI